jgi:hypothetical protein
VSKLIALVDMIAWIWLYAKTQMDTRAMKSYDETASTETSMENTNSAQIPKNKRLVNSIRMIKFLQGRNQNDILINNCKLNKGKQKIIKDGKLTYINEMTNLSSQNIN